MNNKSIWITGASSGIGKALALKFAKEGWKVAISARRENLLNEISQSNENIMPFPLDVKDSENCKSVYDYYKSRKSGHISIVSSVAGYRGLPAAGAYCASKSALSSFAESLYFDLKRFNVRVSLVSPGFIKTPMTDKNDFPMPMIKSPEFAADQMFKGLTKNKGFEIHFPKSFTSIMKVLKVMPNGLYFKIIEKGMKKIVD